MLLSQKEISRGQTEVLRNNEAKFSLPALNLQYLNIPPIFQIIFL